MLAMTSISMMCACSISPESARKEVTELTVSNDKPDSGTPRLVKVTQDSEDIPIASYDVTQYGANGEDEEDDAPAFQNAMNDAEKAGGGVVFAPAGNYTFRIELVLPQNVTLRGDWKSPEQGGLGQGTILKIYTGKGKENDTPFITYKSGSTLRDLTLWYPEQDDINNIQPYPWMTKSDKDNGYYGGNFFNLTVINAFKGFYIAPNNGHYLRNIYGTFLKEGIYVDQVYDIGRLEGISMKPEYWADSGLGKTPSREQVSKYLKKSAIGLLLYKSDWEYIYDIKMESYQVGILFDSVGKGSFNGQIYGLNIQDAQVGMQINSMSDIGTVVSASRIHVSGDNSMAVYGTRGFIGFEAVLFNTCTFSAPDGRNAYLEGDGVLNFNHCTFEDWKKGNYSITAQAGSVTATACNFKADKAEIRLDTEVTSANIYANEFQGNTPEITVKTKHKEGVFVDIDSAKPSSIPAMPQIPLQQPEYPRPDNGAIFNVREYGAVADEKTDDTESFQKALSAAKKIGGTVYVPAGRYRLEGTLTIPKNVELRGASDGPKHYGVENRGTVLVSYANEGNENGTPFISLGKKAGIRGLSIFYPNQHYKNAIKYPATIKTEGKNAYIIDVTIPNAYTAIYITHPGYDLRYIRGMGLKRFIAIEESIEQGSIFNKLFKKDKNDIAGGYIENMMCTVGDWQDGLREENAPPKDWWKNMPASMSTAIEINNSSHVSLFNNFSFGMAYGVVVKGNSSDINALGHGVDASLQSIVLEGNGQNLNFINNQLVGVESYLYTKPSFEGTAAFYNSLSWGPGGKVMLDGKGEVKLQQWKSTTAPFLIKGGTVWIDSSLLHSTSDQVIVEETMERASLKVNTGNNIAFGISTLGKDIKGIEMLSNISK